MKLTPARIESIAKALEEVSGLPDPVGEVIESNVRPNGLKVLKVRVPLGVVFFIYESRPNVTADAAAICVMSGNAVILRGGKEAAHSSLAIVDLLRQALDGVGLPSDAVQLVNTADREAVGHFLGLHEYIDLAIPRGGEGLIRRVAAEATMPVIKHFTGNCHVYVDRAADLDMAQKNYHQRQVPADGRVQRRRIAAGARRRGRQIPAAHRNRAGETEYRNPRRRENPRVYCQCAFGNGRRLRGGIFGPDYFLPRGRFAG